MKRKKILIVSLVLIAGFLIVQGAIIRIAQGAKVMTFPSGTTCTFDSGSTLTMGGTTTVTTLGVTTLNATTGNIPTLNVGASGTVGTAKVYPATAAKGYLALSCTNQTGDTAVTIDADAMGQATVFNLTDPGAAACYFATSTAALTLAEVDILDGATVSTAELNILDGVVKTTAEVNEVYLFVEIDDVSTAGQVYVVSPIAGNVTAIYSVLNGTIATADAVLTSKIAGTGITDGVITIAYSGSAAGDVDTVSPSALNAITKGAAIEVETSGASTNAEKVFITIIITAT